MQGLQAGCLQWLIPFRLPGGVKPALASCGWAGMKKAGISAGGGALSQRRGAFMGKRWPAQAPCCLEGILKKEVHKMQMKPKARRVPSRALPMLQL